MANQAAQTAYGPMSIVAFEQSYPEEQRLVHDRLALQFLPPGVKAIAGLAKWSPIRNWMFTILDRRATGVLGGTLCRKRYIDEKLLDALSTGIQACVILGAGLDTRAYRLEALRAMQVFEVDLPENSAYKKRKLLELYGRIPSHVTLIPLDFERQPLTDLLAASGYESEQKSFFICEAVSQYLSQAGMRNLFGWLAQAQTGSKLIFTYIRKDFIDGTARYGLDTVYRIYRTDSQLWQFGLQPEGVAAFLAGYGWQELEQAGEQEYTERYLKPLRRDMPVMKIERAVYAEKLQGNCG